MCDISCDPSTLRLRSRVTCIGLSAFPKTAFLLTRRFPWITIFSILFSTMFRPTQLTEKSRSLLLPEMEDRRRMDCSIVRCSLLLPYRKKKCLRARQIRILLLRLLFVSTSICHYFTRVLLHSEIHRRIATAISFSNPFVLIR